MSDKSFPPQHQERQPGIEHEMWPHPEFELPEYRGAGKLEGKVAPAIVFLASNSDSSYITGQTIHVNGGEVVGG